ncbi:MAG: beta-1,3-glucanase family protein [Planctomycetaceae bacterium]|jgi:hypothetical protein|nr:beta-1,3-glucanase family protein [Planctomycetaceae bacterium]
MLLANSFRAAVHRRRAADLAHRTRRRLAIESLEARLALASDFKIASITPAAWSVAGGGGLTITLAADSTPFSSTGEQLVTFGSGPQLQASRLSPTQITVTSPALASLTGWSNTPLSIPLTLTDTQQPARPTSGSNQFTVQSAEIQRLSAIQGYQSGGQTITITAPSAAFGFGTSDTFKTAGVTVGFVQGSTTTFGTDVTWVSPMQIQVTTPAVTNHGAATVVVNSATHPISIPLTAGANTYTFVADPVFTKAEIQIVDKTGPLPDGAELYLLLEANGQYYTINTSGTITAAGTSATPTALAAITNKVNGRTTITTTEYLSSARLYFTTSATMTAQPAAGGNAFYYDYVEPTFLASKLNVDTSQVDQFGMPITIQVIPGDPAHTLGSGVNSGITRQQIIEKFKEEMVGLFAAYQDCVTVVAGDPLHQILAPQHVINGQYQAAAVQQAASTSASILPASSSAGGWLATITVPATLGGQVKQGSFVSGPFIPAGTYVQSISADRTILTVVNTGGSSNPFPTKTVTPTVGGTGLNFVPVPPGGFTGMASWFGPTWQSTANVNSGNAIDDFFAFYKTNTFWQEDNGTTSVVLYEGKVTQITATDINGETSTYAVLQFKDAATTPTDTGTYNIFYPYFTTNSPVGKQDPFGHDVPPPPAYFTLGNSLQALVNYMSPSEMIFGASGVFADQKGQAEIFPSQNQTVLADLERDVAAALIRGYGTTLVATANAVDAADLPTFTPDQTDATKGTWTLTSAADRALAPLIKPGMYVSSFRQLSFPLKIDSVTTVGQTVQIAATAVNALPAYAPDNLQFFHLYETGSVYDAYSAFFQNKGDFTTSLIDGKTVNIDGRAYGDPYSDFMDFSSDIEARPSLTGPSNQTAVLQITLDPWGTTAGSSIAFVSGDFDGNGLDDVAELTGTGQWRVALTPAAGDPTTQNVGTPWATAGIDWEDVTVIRRGDRDVIVARASGTGIGSWWKLSYDGTAWSTDFVGSWLIEGAWLDFVAGDFDGNGKTDIAARSHDLGEWWMLADAAETATPADYAAKNVKIGEWNPGVDWKAVVAGDFDGGASPRDSIAGLAGTTWWQLDYTGPGTFTNTAITTNWSDQTTWSDFSVGNFSGAADGKEGIAARNASNAWYTVSNTGTPSQQPTLMATWAAGTWKNVVVGNFAGDATGAVGIAGRQNSTGAWYVVQKQGSGYQSVNYQGAWPTTSAWAQAFAGIFTQQAGSPKKAGILGRSPSSTAGNTWWKAVSNGTAFTSAAAPGYPS